MLTAVLVVTMTAVFASDDVLAQERSPRVDDPAPEIPRVRRISNESYAPRGRIFSSRETMDWYLPPRPNKAVAKKSPIVMFIHGGAWAFGDKRNRREGLETFAYNLARAGIVTVMINYRLSPWVKHPTHIQDVARALAHIRKRAEKRGGDVDRLFVAGHSAGGHLATLLALHPNYLEGVGLARRHLAGVIGISGVYDVTASETTLMRHVGSGFGRFLIRNVFRRPADARDATPERHATPGAPPFLLLAASRDLPGLARQAMDFEKALHKAKIPVDRQMVMRTGHVGIMREVGMTGSHANRAVTDFIRKTKAASSRLRRSSRRSPSSR